MTRAGVRDAIAPPTGILWDSVGLGGVVLLY